MRYRVVYKKRFIKEGDEARPAKHLFSTFPTALSPVRSSSSASGRTTCKWKKRWTKMTRHDREFKEVVLNCGMAMEIDRVEEVEEMPALEGQ